MSRRYADLDDLIDDLDHNDSLADDPFGVAAFDDEDLAILGGYAPDKARPVPKPKPPSTPAPKKRGRPKKTP